MSRLPVAHRTSLYSESTVPSTIWGPGTVAGRAILALGEAALRGVDRLIDLESRSIRKRLLQIERSVLTPEMCGDLIELSYPGLYSQEFQDTAISILYDKINSFRYGPAVAVGLAKIPPSEAEAVMVRLFASRGFQKTSHWYELRLPRRDNLLEDVTLNFLSLLIQLQPELTAACCEVINHLCRSPDPRIRLLTNSYDHPILRIHGEESLHIPLLCRTSLSELQRTFFPDPMHRWNIWNSLGLAGHSAENRLFDIDRAVLKALAEHFYTTPDFFDAAVDLLDFIRYTKVTALRRVAIDQLISYISISRECWEPLKSALILSQRNLPCLSITILAYDTPKMDPQLRQFLHCAIGTPLSDGVGESESISDRDREDAGHTSVRKTLLHRQDVMEPKPKQGYRRNEPNVKRGPGVGMATRMFDTVAESTAMDAAELARWTGFAAKGGIGKCTAVDNCVAQTPQDLMFLKNDEIVVLLQLPENDIFLGYCEGVVGRFRATDVHFHSTRLKNPAQPKE